VGKRKINIKFQLVSVKTVTKSVDSSEAASEFLFRLSFAVISLVIFILCSCHCRLSEQFSESQVAFGTNFKVIGGCLPFYTFNFSVSVPRGLDLVSVFHLDPDP
jgi:hypothetical protein